MAPGTGDTGVVGWCGLDVGSTTVEAVVTEAGGSRLLARARLPTPVTHPRPGWVEHDPTALADTARRALDEVLAAAGTEVAALGIVSQRATVVAWDARTGEALGPAISWQDRRTTERVETLLASGVLALDSAAAPKAWWLLEHVTAVRDAAGAGRLRLGPVDAWIAACLAGPDAAVTDVAQASTTLVFDPGAGAWDPAAAAAHGVPVDALVPLVDTVGVHSRAEIGGRDLALAARSGDQSGSCVALGVTAPGRVKVSLGTSGMLDEHTGSEPGGGGGTYPVALWRLDGTVSFAREGVIHAAGSSLDWLVEVGLLDDPADLDVVAGAVDDAAGVWFVPALAGLGAPFHDTTARGRFEGLTRATGRAHLVRAVVEGIAHRVVDLLEAVGVGDGSPVVVDGGLTRSRVLIGRIADLAGREVQVAAPVPVAAVGAAHLAGLGVGAVTGLPTAPLVATETVAPAGPDPAGERAAWREVLDRTRRSGR